MTLSQVSGLHGRHVDRVVARVVGAQDAPYVGMWTPVRGKALVYRMPYATLKRTTQMWLQGLNLDVGMIHGQP